MGLDAVIKWNNKHAIVMLITSIITIYIGRLDLLFLVAAVSFIGLFVMAKDVILSLKPMGGYCNWVTATRLLLLGVFCFGVHGQDNAIAWLILLSIVIVMDAMDGYLARKFNHHTIFGQYFDMEVDALFVLILSFYYYTYFDLPFWILIPAFLRYIYKVTRMMVIKRDFQEPKRKLASYIAGYHFVVLLLGMAVSEGPRFYLLLSGSVLVIISFSVSYFEFFGHIALARQNKY